jgi:hypothetical protein
MNPAEIIKRASEDGVQLARSPSGSISARGAQSAIDRWLPAIRQSRAAIVRLLRPRSDGWSAEDWQVFFDERAGIAEFDGALSRVEAEASAYAHCLAEWLNRDCMRSPPGRCFGCGGYESLHNRLLPFGIGRSGEVWLHSRCQPAWYAGRKAEAIAALATMGIRAPANFPKDFGKNGSA